MSYEKWIVAYAALSALSCGTAHAEGGASSATPVYEISQSCIAAGCFAGDAPGFPVTASASGLYRVVSDLQLDSATANLHQTVIDLRPGTPESRVVLDLQQHSITGNGDARYGGCLVRLNAGETSLINGAVRHGGGHGVCAEAWQSLLVEGVSITNNFAYGLKVFTGISAATTLDHVVLAHNGHGGFEHDHKRGPSNQPSLAVANLTFVFQNSQFNGNWGQGIHIVEGSVRLQDNHFVGNGGPAAYMEESVYTFFGGNSAHMNGGAPSNVQFVVRSPDRRIALANNACINCFGP